MVQDSVTASKMSESESEGRKWSKPIMEKRRRERINRSLDELKRLVLEAQNRDSSRYTKLEKADILEMTVKHLRGLRSRQKSAAAAALVSQTLIPGAVNVGCCGCEVGHYVIPDNVVMETRDRAHTSPHLVGISTNLQDRSYIDSSGPCAPGATARDRSFSTGAAVPNSQGVAQSRVRQPLHVNTAVHFIPICSSNLPNSTSIPGTLAESNESYYYSHGEQFWRPF